MKTIRIHLVVFISLLVLSGITAFPLISEIDFLQENRDLFTPVLASWITKLHGTIHSTPGIMLYGTDWLAFAHIIIALFFIPVLTAPVQHQVNLKIGMIACLLVFPLAFICGPVREIPFFHQLIDCAFGVLGFLYLYFINYRINKLKTAS